VHRLPYFKGRACKLDFPALHESNFAAYFTGCQLFGPEKSIFEAKKSIKKSILDPKFVLKLKKSISSIVFST